jgi:hypothetical protein
MTDTTRRPRTLVRPMTNNHHTDATKDPGRRPVEGMDR